MNRAWIPAGALASVSVAGLIALGQLTDSLSTPVSFPSVVTVTTPLPQKGSVAVSYNSGTVGQVTRASLSQGGRVTAATTNAPTSGEAGQVGYRRTVTRPSTATPVAKTVTTVKKTVKRPSSISGTSGPNGDAGLAGGGSKGPAVAGEQSSTPGP